MAPRLRQLTSGGRKLIDDRNVVLNGIGFEPVFNLVVQRGSNTSRPRQGCSQPVPFSTSVRSPPGRSSAPYID